MGKKKGRRMPAWKRWARAAVSLVGGAIGAAVALSPTFAGISRAVRGDPLGGINQVAFDTTGIDPSNPGTIFTPDKLLRTGVVAGIGIGLIMLFRAVARRL